jgi:hypothetical protein
LATISTVLAVKYGMIDIRPIHVQEAHRRCGVASANAQIGVAQSAYHPVISLSGGGGFESSSITTLLNGPAGLWSFGLGCLPPAGIR